MPDIQVDVRQARRNDIERINLLLDQARRACVRFGYEDLVHMIDHDFCYVAETGALLWGFICASVRQPGLAHLRGLGLINGWRVDGGIERLLQTLEVDLRREKVSDLLYLATESWLTSPLLRQGFFTQDYIITYERSAPASPLLPAHQAPDARVRPLKPGELSALAALDHSAFAWPWQFSSGELVQLLLTTSRLVVLEVRGEAVGYSCIDIQGERVKSCGWRCTPPARDRVSDAISSPTPWTSRHPSKSPQSPSTRSGRTRRQSNSTWASDSAPWASVCP